MIGTHESIDMVQGLVELVNGGYIKKSKVELNQFQRVDLYIYDQDVFKTILKECKFKDVGNVYDYPEILPQPDSIRVYNSAANYDLFLRIAISNKMNSILYYTADSYSISCMFLVDIKNMKKFIKKSSAILKEDTGANIFRDTDFNCSEKKYIEIMDPTDDNTKTAEIVMRLVPEENLVFDKQSTINKVMNDIKSFFTDETEKLYKKLELPYKRGIILYGDPGNGKSAMIRQIIRTVPHISKIVINPNVSNVTTILSSLTKALNGKKAIVIIEDIDSLITDRNRSEFLNVLDGVDIRSGVYFIGTTNYPDRIDPAFMNRSGRFDRTYEIGNPTTETRRAYFSSREVDKLFSDYQVYDDNDVCSSKAEIVDIFVKYSDNLPMASLKELITTAAYMMASGEQTTIESAVRKSYNDINGNRINHINSHNKYKAKMNSPFANMQQTYVEPQELEFTPIDEPEKKKEKKTKELRKVSFKKLD